MTDTDALDFTRAFGRLVLAFNVPMPAERAEVYWEALRDLSLAAWQRAVAAAICVCERFPAPAELRRLAYAAPGTERLPVQRRLAFTPHTRHGAEFAAFLAEIMRPGITRAERLEVIRGIVSRHPGVGWEEVLASEEQKPPDDEVTVGRAMPPGPLRPSEEPQRKRLLREQARVLGVRD